MQPQTPTPDERFSLLLETTNQALQLLGEKTAPIATAIANIKANLATGSPDSEKISRELEAIENQLQEMQEIREALLGPPGLRELRPAMVADVVQAAAFFSQLPQEKFTLNLAPDTPLALTDTTLLARALGYLFQNALEAGATHISANITPTFGMDHVAISVADDGAGIPRQVRNHIWRPFFSTKGETHIGLGLTACLHIINQLDGRITVDSDEGRGAIFTLVLPAAADDVAVDLSHAPANILFVDEEDDAWALFAANVLKLAGKNVVVQGTPAGAAAADLILVDEALTTMPVAEVLAQLQQAGVAHKAVVVTAAFGLDRAQKYMQSGVKDVALKPYTYTGLAALFLERSE